MLVAREGLQRRRRIVLIVVGRQRLAADDRTATGLCVLRRAGVAFPVGRFATAQAAELPPGAVLMVSGNDTAFLWRYLQGVEGRRPDVVVVPRVLLGHPHERLRLEAPLRSAGIRWTPDLRDAPLVQLRAARRPAFIEVRQPERGAGLSAHGVVAAIGSGPETPTLAALRGSTLAALEGPEARGDTESALVAAFFRSLWEER